MRLMKINEACKRTGLSERAIRFYVEKGLLEPKSQIINGRTTVEYSEDDIEILIDISTLRKAGFSIADILAMQNSTDNVCDIITKHCSVLEQEQIFREELIQQLNEISKRGNISWTKLSNILFQNTREYTEQSICIPLEETEVFKTEKKSFWDGLKRVLKWGVLLFFVALVIFVFAYNKHNNEILTSSFSVCEVVVEKKWRRHENYYVSVYSLYSEDGIEAYFKSPRTIQTGSREYYEAFQIGDEPYDSFEVWIEIPRADAKEEEILDEKGNILIEKVLDSERLARDYCFIKRIDNN